ncbi:hypothetical protein OPKNFCMD_2685 [Methylobacterium crusticola]|uniref:Uncharacterized protein n=1 Tax=Methylobacterium crusticola TaxID=1697972 RepID=A0ABQ4QXL0_9HYPH|nr:hypothetical protein [Methylobacterium crusticola]GJD49949.1 hypothetical protein OPKNFCMD_2685 [Methylobacterium crusticola]
MKVLCTSLARTCASALIGLVLALVAVSAADAAPGRNGPVLRAGNAPGVLASLHAQWAKSPACTLSAAGVDNPRPDDGGAAGEPAAGLADGQRRAAVTLLPPRRLGSGALAGPARLDRPPKTEA